MKLPPELDLTETDEITLNAAELAILKDYIRRLQDDRDHARRWAAWHQADAKQERHRLHLLLTFGRTPRKRAEHIMGKRLPEPADLAAVAADGWIGMLADTATSAAVRVLE